jgi:tellurite resistance protein TerC
MDRFKYLQLGLALVLTFIGVKMLAAHWVHISPALSLGIVTGILSVAIGASLLRKRPDAGNPPAE